MEPMRAQDKAAGLRNSLQAAGLDSRLLAVGVGAGHRVGEMDARCVTMARISRLGNLLVDAIAAS
jgi:hypothetical protein